MFLVFIVDSVQGNFQLQMEFAQDNVFWEKSIQMHKLWSKKYRDISLKGAFYYTLP